MNEYSIYIDQTLKLMFRNRFTFYNAASACNNLGKRKKKPVP